MKRIAPASLAAPRRATPTIPRLRRLRPRKARRYIRRRSRPAGESWQPFPGLWPAWHGRTDRPFIRVDRAWMSEIGAADGDYPADTHTIEHLAKPPHKNLAGGHI